ncbi:glycosyltransferase [Prevotella sp. 10(H)]|uniref:glycosyltransferase n=1 Tax=Prevotella sp. 10(H) TaxID=1158294 RepID=UPI000691546D|nr:glycosyltransferase [Prevotella sp. 10(H)]
MKKRSVLIDLRYLEYLTNGFGQLSLNYGSYIKNNADKIQDLDITLLVPKQYIGKFGDHIKYLEFKRKYKFYPFLLPHYDIWHSITQQVKCISIDSNTVRVISIHDLNFLYERSASKAKRKLKRQQAIIDIVDAITAISHFTIGEIETHLNLKGKTVQLNYVGERSIVNDKAETPNWADTDKKFFFTIGQIVEKKNFHILLDMMKLMPEYNLYICGDNSFEYAQYIQQRITDENIENVSLTGTISAEEKVWMYRYCEAFLFPSKFEGFGYPVIEAMLFGKPVFSSSCTSLPEIGDKYAFFWENFDPEYMKNIITDNIQTFYNNDAFIEDQIKYANSYTLERHMSFYLNLYRSIPIKKRKNPLTSIYNYYKFLKS